MTTTRPLPTFAVITGSGRLLGVGLTEHEAWEEARKELRSTGIEENNAQVHVAKRGYFWEADYEHHTATEVKLTEMG